MDLARMDTIPARQLRPRAILAKRRQCHLGLEVNTVFLPYIRHRLPFATMPVYGRESLLATCPISGVHLTIRGKITIFLCQLESMKRDVGQAHRTLCERARFSIRQDVQLSRAMLPCT